MVKLSYIAAAVGLAAHAVSLSTSRHSRPRLAAPGGGAEGRNQPVRPG